MYMTLSIILTQVGDAIRSLRYECNIYDFLMEPMDELMYFIHLCFSVALIALVAFDYVTSLTAFSINNTAKMNMKK